MLSMISLLFHRQRNHLDRLQLHRHLIASLVAGLWKLLILKSESRFMTEIDHGNVKSAGTYITGAFAEKHYSTYCSG